MLQALAENTAGLKVAAGRVPAISRPTPRDALYSGAMQAVCGAIEQMRARIDADPAQVTLLSRRRRRAARSRRTSTPPVEVVDNLVLEGVLALAGRKLTVHAPSCARSSSCCCSRT